MEVRVCGGVLAAAMALLACDGPSKTTAPAPEPATTAAENSSGHDETDPNNSTSVVAEEEAPIVPVAPLPIPGSSRVVLVTIDGVRWEDVFDAKGESLAPSMPNLDRLVRERGVALGGPTCTNDVRVAGPSFVSLPGYMEIFGGKPTACTHNYCAPMDSDTFVDQARATVSSSSDIAVFASWNRYADAVAHHRGAIVLSAGARIPNLVARNAMKEDTKLRSMIELGAMSAGYPGHGDYRPDATTAKLALHYLETNKPRLLVLGLGDADEHAHRGEVAAYKRAIQRADATLGDLASTLDRMGEDGARTTVIVTTDHGRATSLRAHGALYPESQRVWVAAFGESVAHRGVSCATQPLKLTQLASAVRAFLRIEDQDEPSPMARELLTQLQ